MLFYGFSPCSGVFCSQLVLRVVLKFWPNDGPTTLGIRQEKNPTTQITLSFCRQISTIAADLIGMIGCPSGPTRICVGPDAGPVIRGSVSDESSPHCSVAFPVRSRRICVRHVCGAFILSVSSSTVAQRSSKKSRTGEVMDLSISPEQLTLNQ